MNHKKYKKFIVVNELGKPMTFVSLDKTGGSFLLCQTELSRRPLAAKSYTLKEARKLIEITKEWRTKKDYPVRSYILMPINP
jgi:hypothetical protein